MKNLTDYIQEGLKITKDTEIDDFYDTPGVYAYFKGEYMTDDEHYIKEHKNDAIGVAVISEVDEELYRIVLDKTDISNKKVYFGGYNKKIEGATTAEYLTIARQDMKGYKNTIAISKACYEYNDGKRTGSAAEDCQARFNGKGHLPSLGELQMLYDNKDEVDKMMSIIGGTAIKENWYWSSTLYDALDTSWAFHLNNGYPGYYNCLNGLYARAVMEI